MNLNKLSIDYLYKISPTELDKFGDKEKQAILKAEKQRIKYAKVALKEK